MHESEELDKPNIIWYLSSQLQVVLQRGQPGVTPGPQLCKVGLEALSHLCQGFPMRFLHLSLRTHANGTGWHRTVYCS